MEDAERRALAGDAVAYVCEHLELMPGWLLPDDQPLLQQFTASIDDGDELPAVLEALDAALKRGGDASGLWRTVARSSHPIAPATGFGSSRPADGWFLCPRNRCVGREPSPQSPGQQICAAFGGEPLRWKQV
jgi:hypothetical protein